MPPAAAAAAFGIMSPAAAIDPSTLDPATVTTMVEIRLAIDHLDRRIVALLGDRMRFIEAAARVKPSRKAVRDEWRKQDVITKAAAAAETVNFPPQLVRDVYEVLVEGSIGHEFATFDARKEKIEDGPIIQKIDKLGAQKEEIEDGPITQEFVKFDTRKEKFEDVKEAYVWDNGAKCQM